MDYTDAARQLWEQLDREHDGNSIIKDELGAMEWGELPPAVRAMLCGVVRAFLERVKQSERRPHRKAPDFDALAAEAMARATQFDTIPKWVAGTIAAAYRLGKDGQE